jgi:hypothetical protein
MNVYFVFLTERRQATAEGQETKQEAGSFDTEIS